MSDDLDISLDDITYQEKTLTDWADDLTVQMPSFPMNHQTIANVVIQLSNKYQIAYNAYNELYVMYSSLNKRLTDRKNAVIATKIEEYKEKGVAGRMPGKEALEAIALNESSTKQLNDSLKMCEIVKDFFEHNKNKLEKSQQLVLNISYAVNQSDRVWNKSGAPSDKT